MNLPTSGRSLLCTLSVILLGSIGACANDAEVQRAQRPVAHRDAEEPQTGSNLPRRSTASVIDKETFERSRQPSNNTMPNPVRNDR